MRSYQSMSKHVSLVFFILYYYMDSIINIKDKFVEYFMLLWKEIFTQNKKRNEKKNIDKLSVLFSIYVVLIKFGS